MLCILMPFLIKLCSPPCSRSIITTTSETIRPSFLKSAAVSRMLPPEVTTSSTIKQVSPSEYIPSIIFMVPYFLGSFLLTNIGILDLTETKVAMGRAVYGTPQITLQSIPNFCVCFRTISDNSSINLGYDVIILKSKYTGEFTPTFILKFPNFKAPTSHSFTHNSSILIGRMILSKN
uniref:Secreted protein n=1 Tax=Panstrongylus lignarius TaxID=156445 RepID=A0A224XZJ0_9HEMI